jgi:hypothetical protein
MGVKMVKNMSIKDEESFLDVEQEFFKALENQKRRDTLRIIGERKGITFTEILNVGKLPDSPTLSYHLKTLSSFIEQRDGRYHLSPLGKEAYSFLLKTTSYGKVAVFHGKRYGATFGNLLLWAIGVAAAMYLGADTTLTFIIMPFLAFIATTTTYQLFQEVR